MFIIDQILSLLRVCCYCVFKLLYQKSSSFNRQMMSRDRFISFSHFRDVAVFVLQKKFLADHFLKHNRDLRHHLIIAF